MLGYNITKTKSQSVSHVSLDYSINAVYDATQNNTQTNKLSYVLVTLAASVNLTEGSSESSYTYSGSITTNTSESYQVVSLVNSNQTSGLIPYGKQGQKYLCCWFENSTASVLKVTGASNYSANDTVNYNYALWYQNGTADNYGSVSESNNNQYTNASGTFQDNYQVTYEYLQSSGQTLSSNGTLTENEAQPTGTYSFISSLVQGSNNYTSTVTLPNGTRIDPGYWTFSGWHGSNELIGAVLWANANDMLGIGFVSSVLGLLIGLSVALETFGIGTAVFGVMIAAAPFYQDTNGIVYMYFEAVISHWWIFSWSSHAEVGFWTNHLQFIHCCQYYLGSYWYIPIVPSSLLWHSSVWPNGY